MRPGVLLRLAVAGSGTDTARVLLTAVSAALATLVALSALTVLSIEPAPSTAPAGDSAACPADNPNVVCPGSGLSDYATQYQHALLVEPGLRPGVAFALLLLSIPVLALAGQSARLGAPARDRRLSAFRLAGATPRQVLTLAAAETGLAAALGTLLGLGTYFAARTLLHRPDAAGQLPLPTDQLPPVWAIVLLCAGLPLLGAGMAALLLRRVRITPFGVVRRQRTRAPRPWPGALIVLGVAAFALVAPLTEYLARTGRELPDWLPTALLLSGGLLAMLGVVLGTAWISHFTGRLLHRFARRPALLAGRRLVADPWLGSRVFAALLACVMVGAGAAAVRALFTAMFTAEQEANRAQAAAQGQEYGGRADDYAFYYNSLDLVNAAVGVATVIAGLGLLVFLVESLVSRRRTYAALVAAGVPRRTLAGATAWQLLGPAVPAVLLAAATGVALPRGLSQEETRGGNTMMVCDTDWDQCQEPDSPYLRTVEIPEFVHPVEVPVAEVAAVAGVGVATVLVTVGIGLSFLRASTDVSELRVS